MFLGDFVFYVLLMPIRLGLRAAAWPRRPAGLGSDAPEEALDLEIRAKSDDVVGRKSDRVAPSSRPRYVPQRGEKDQRVAAEECFPKRLAVPGPQLLAAPYTPDRSVRADAGARRAAEGRARRRRRRVPARAGRASSGTSRRSPTPPSLRPRPRARETRPRRAPSSSAARRSRRARGTGDRGARRSPDRRSCRRSRSPT